MAWSEDVQILRALLPRLSAAADFDEEITLTPKESGTLVRYITRKETGR